LTGEHRNAQVSACIELDSAAVKHWHSRTREILRLRPGRRRCGVAGDIEGARILVRPEANERKRPKIAVTAKPLDQFR
jgi:hypothetical protein